MKLLSYTHVHRVVNATGVGRVIKNVVEGLARSSDIDLRILANQQDANEQIPRIGPPWTELPLYTFDRSVSAQQLQWLVSNRESAESWWPELDTLYMASESFVPSKKAKSIVTIFDVAYFEKTAHRWNMSNTLQRAKWNFLFNKLDRHVDMIHTISNFSAERIAHFFPAMTNRIRVAPIGISEEFFAPPSNADLLADETMREQQKKFILVPGGLWFRKNADLILAAWPVLQAKHPELELRIVNSSDPDYFEKAKTMPGIRHLGFVTDPELRTLYRTSEIVWFPSRYEGFGLPVAEAMASGTPVVASDAASLPEVGGDAVLYAAVDDVQGHIDAIEGLLDDASMCQFYSDKGLHHSKRFRWTNAVETIKRDMLAL